jgi:hypothetical protein
MYSGCLILESGKSCDIQPLLRRWGQLQPQATAAKQLRTSETGTFRISTVTVELSRRKQIGST